MGQNVLIYERIVDCKEQLTMTRSALMDARFAVAAVVKGDAGNSTQSVQSVQLVTQTGVDLPPVRDIDVSVTSNCTYSSSSDTLFRYTFAALELKGH